MKENGDDRFEVEPWMINPYDPPNKIFYDLPFSSGNIKILNVCFVTLTL